MRSLETGESFSTDPSSIASFPSTMDVQIHDRESFGNFSPQYHFDQPAILNGYEFHASHQETLPPIHGLGLDHTQPFSSWGHIYQGAAFENTHDPMLSPAVGLRVNDPLPSWVEQVADPRELHNELPVPELPDALGDATAGCSGDLNPKSDLPVLIKEEDSDDETWVSPPLFIFAPRRRLCSCFLLCRRCTGRSFLSCRRVDWHLPSHLPNQGIGLCRKWCWKERPRLHGYVISMCVARTSLIVLGLLVSPSVAALSP